jgi:nucleotide-binding universal stress UspA family protein
MEFKNILFPVDFSERCRTVAPFVNAAVKRNGACLTLLNFVEVPFLWYGAVEAPCAPEMNIGCLIEEAERSLALFAKEFFPCLESSGNQAKVRVEEGDPGSRIVEAARASSVDLIMMPTRGRGSFRAALLGSVTAKVLHDAECGVWTAAHTETPEHHASREWRNVVCAIDLTPDAPRLIRYARELSRDYDATVHLVHAIPSPPATRMEQYLSRDFEAFLKDSARQAIDAMQKDAGTDFELCVEAGNVSSIVAAAAQAHEADLVLAGRGVLPRFGGRLRTHVYGIIRQAPCPVLSI